MELTEEEFLEQLDELGFARLRDSSDKYNRAYSISGIRANDSASIKELQRYGDAGFIFMSHKYYESPSTGKKDDWVRHIRLFTTVNNRHVEQNVYICGNEKTSRVTHRPPSDYKCFGYTEGLRNITRIKAMLIDKVEESLRDD